MPLNCYYTTTATTGSCTPTWYSWVNSSNLTYSNQTWVSWNSITSTSLQGQLSQYQGGQFQGQYLGASPYQQGYNQLPQQQPPALNAEELMAQQQAFMAAQERAEREQAARRQRREQAAVRARHLLKESLSPEQETQLEREKCFELRVDDRLYRISPGNLVARLDPVSKKPLERFCIHPSSEHELPPEDVALTQKLMLETDEVSFLKIANRLAA